ncbi:hypothetical protein D3C83_47030 [compost metagenome]
MSSVKLRLFEAVLSKVSVLPESVIPVVSAFAMSVRNALVKSASSASSTALAFASTRFRSIESVCPSASVTPL